MAETDLEEERKVIGLMFLREDWESRRCSGEGKDWIGEVRSEEKVLVEVTERLE